MLVDCAVFDELDDDGSLEAGARGSEPFSVAVAPLFRPFKHAFKAAVRDRFREHNVRVVGLAVFDLKCRRENVAGLDHVQEPALLVADVLGHFDLPAVDVRPHVAPIDQTLQINVGVDVHLFFGVVCLFLGCR